MSWNALRLCQTLGGTLKGVSPAAAEAIELNDVSSLDVAKASDLVFLDSKKGLAQAATTTAGVLLTNETLAAMLPGRGCQLPLIVVADPKGAFIEAMLLFRPQPPREMIGVSPHAFVSSTATIGTDVNIHAGAHVGEHVRIGDRCEIHPGVILGDGCELGDDCVLYPHVVLYKGVMLRNRVTVHANSVLGADGFGYRFRNGAFEKIPHTGSVLIEDDVELGACTTIDRGMVGSTVIGRGTKLDNQVMIAHNCRIGEHNVFASQVGLAGSVTTGNYVQMGGQVGVADHLHIGHQTKFGGKAGVIWDIPDGQVSHGIPAIPEKDAIRNHFLTQKLPELRDQIKQLTAQLAELSAQVAEKQLPSTSPSDRAAA